LFSFSLKQGSACRRSQVDSVGARFWNVVEICKGGCVEKLLRMRASRGFM
jgi:hypothetical protein